MALADLTDAGHRKQSRFMTTTVSEAQGCFLRIQIFKSSLTVTGGGSGEDRVGHSNAGVRVKVCWCFLRGAASLGCSDAFLQSIMHKVGCSDKVLQLLWAVGSRSQFCGELSHLGWAPCVKVEKLDSFQRHGYFLRKGRAQSSGEAQTWGVCAKRRSEPNVPKIFPTAETEEHLIWEFRLCLWVSSG